jgi:hypothetical protein
MTKKEILLNKLQLYAEKELFKTKLNQKCRKRELVDKKKIFAVVCLELRKNLINIRTAKKIYNVKIPKPVRISLIDIQRCLGYAQHATILHLAINFDYLRKVESEVDFQYTILSQKAIDIVKELWGDETDLELLLEEERMLYEKIAIIQKQKRMLETKHTLSLF